DTTRKAEEPGLASAELGAPDASTAKGPAQPAQDDGNLTDDEPHPHTRHFGPEPEKPEWRPPVKPQPEPQRPAAGSAGKQSEKPHPRNADHSDRHPGTPHTNVPNAPKKSSSSRLGF